MNEYENMTKEELLTRCFFLDEVVAERNEQIEKMKCCGNCKFSEIDGTFCYTYKQEQNYVEKCSRWELVE